MINIYRKICGMFSIFFQIIGIKNLQKKRKKIVNIQVSNQKRSNLFKSKEIKHLQLKCLKCKTYW